MLKILINSYACCPGMGSEPGMGWNWIVALAKYCELFIITEGEFRPQIESWLSDSRNGEYAQNMHFCYLPIGGKDEEKSAKIRKRCWNQGDWRFYLSYAKWQQRSLELARSICKNQKIDVLHQLNMIGFREPGCLYKLSKETGIPLIWGPINAKEGFPTAYLKGAPLKSRLFIYIKNFITKLQLRFSLHVRRTANQASFVVAASSDSGIAIKKYFGKDFVLLNESGCDVENVDIVKSKIERTFDVLWVGRFIFTKQLEMALKVISLVNIDHLRLHVVGGSVEDEIPYKKIAKSFGIEQNIVWHQKVSHDEVQLLMRQSDLFFFTSIAEGTPHVVLEAFNNKLPVLCFDTCGHGDSVDESVGIKIPLTNPEQSIKDFANAIIRLYNNRDLLERMSSNCHKRAVELSWENKALQMLELYNNVVLSRDKGVSCSETGMTVGENDDIVGL